MEEARDNVYEISSRIKDGYNITQKNFTVTVVLRLELTLQQA